MVEATETPPSIVIKRRVVPNEKPIDEPTPYRIAIIGEAPGEDEENHNRPFIGKAGQFLGALLRNNGIDRTRCYVGNVCGVRPPGNDISYMSWPGEEIQSGIATLHHDIQEFNPNICILLGNTPLHLAKVGPTQPPKRGSQLAYPHKITSWRGSLFISNAVESPFYNRKCIATLHPAGVLREFSGFPLLQFDLKRAREEGETSSLQLPQRSLITNEDPSVLCHIMDNWPSGQRCSLDIEGGLPLSMVNLAAQKKKEGQTRYGWPCVSICARPTKSFTIAWGRMSVQDHIRTLQSFARLMYRVDVPKVLQNQLYDNFVLSFGYGIPIRNVTEDTMIKGWEIYAELPRALSVQASIWTREPFWKDDSMYSGTGEGLFRGCALDSAVTMELCSAQDSVMSGLTQTHYRTMISMQNPFLFMELKGIKYDTEAVTKKLAEVDPALTDLAKRIEDLAGKSVRGPKGSLSAKKLQEFLYLDRKYPPQYAKERGRKTTKLTTDIEAILTLKKHAPHDELLSDILRHRHLEGVRETLQIATDPDGRVRCGYSLEAETGRVKCFTSPTGAGANLTTIQKALRGNYRADEGYDFFQCDLEGADGWTVAAHSARLGDRTMLEDYLAGMKPAKIIALLYWFGPVINQLERSDVKWLHDNVFPVVKKLAGDWLYLGCKRVQHGSAYLMGIPTMQLNVLKDSYKESGVPIYMEHSEARRLQDLLFSRYPGIKTWHAWAESHLVAHGTLTAASGHTRVFFGRRFGKDIKDTVKEFLAHEPQNNTTWATNLAMLNLWNDPENRRGDGSLIIEPLHQVHDALCGQWPQALREWARAKVRSYFNNKLTISGIDLIIPFDGTWGDSWGTMTNKL